jgi:hypothetical protein
VPSARDFDYSKEENRSQSAIAKTFQLANDVKTVTESKSVDLEQINTITVAESPMSEVSATNSFGKEIENFS